MPSRKASRETASLPPSATPVVPQARVSTARGTKPTVLTGVGGPVDAWPAARLRPQLSCHPQLAAPLPYAHACAVHVCMCA